MRTGQSPICLPISSQVSSVCCAVHLGITGSCAIVPPGAQMRTDRYIESVLKKCSNLRDCGLWLSEPAVRPAAWLRNFADEDAGVAAVLLDHFMYFSDPAVNRMLATGFTNLLHSAQQSNGIAAREAILKHAVFTAVEGETPNPTDSGLLFCRKLRQILGLSDSRFATPADALETAMLGRPVVFLDDFIGSGDQFLKTWTREYRPTAPKSFADARATRPYDAHYLALVSTETGASRLAQEALPVRLHVNHTVGPSYGVASAPRSAFLPDIHDLPRKIEGLLDKYHPRLLVDRYLDTPTGRKYGYRGLGLQLAFEHSTPDSTMPIFWAEGGTNWTPLVRRT